MKTSLLRFFYVSLVVSAITVMPGVVFGQMASPQQLTQSIVNSDQDFGYSVDLDGDVAVVGGFRTASGFTLETGAAFVYRFDGSNWVEEQVLEAPAPDFFNWFGWDVAVSGDVILSATRRGDTFAANGGDVVVFRYDGSAWVEEDILTPSDLVVADYGFSLDVDGDVAAVGAPFHTDVVANDGAVYVYRFNGADWVEEDLLTVPGLSVQALFGQDIAIDGDRMLASAFNADDSTSSQAGKLYIFDYDGSHWTQTAELQSNESNSIANLGVSVDLEGEWAVGGAPLDNTLQAGAGAALVYRFDGTNWNFHSKLTASDGQGFFLFGSAVALSGNRLLVTADNWFPPGGDATGKAYVFEYDEINDEWVEMDGFVPANMTTGGAFGHAAAMQADVMMFGAPEYDGAESEMGTAYVYGTPMVATSSERESPIRDLSMTGPFPNPLRGRGTFNMTVANDQPVRISIHDVLGREVAVLHEGHLAAQTYTFTLDASHFASGVYLLRVAGKGFVETRRLSLVK